MNLGSYILEWQCLLRRPTIDVKISLRDDVYTGGGPGAISVKHQEDLEERRKFNSIHKIHQNSSVGNLQFLLIFVSFYWRIHLNLQPSSYETRHRKMVLPKTPSQGLHLATWKPSKQWKS